MDLSKYPQVVDFLRSHRLAAVATIFSDELKPQLAWVYYYLGDDMNIYFMTLQSSRKIKNIDTIEQVAILIAQEVEPMVLQIEGKAKVVRDHPIKSDMWQKIVAIANANPSSLTWPPLMLLKNNEDEYEFVQVSIEHFKFSDFSSNEVKIMGG